MRLSRKQVDEWIFRQAKEEHIVIPKTLEKRIADILHAIKNKGNNKIEKHL